MGRIHVNTIESPFQIDEAHFSEIAYFDELDEDVEVILAKP